MLLVGGLAMKSDFPTSLAKESGALKSVGDNQSSRGRHGAVHQKKSSGRHNVIPMSRAADSMLAMSLDINKGSESSDSVGYPMSEFEVRSSRHQGERRSRARVFLRMTLASVLVGLWISIAMGRLHSDSQFIIALRGGIASILGSFDVQEQLSLEEVSPTSQASSDPIASKVSAGASRSPDSVLAADLEKMAELYADQRSQVNAMEEHIVRLMVEHASPESLSSFLDSMERGHLAALNSMKALKETGKRSAH